MATLVPLEGLEAVAAAIARAKLIVGVRLHALILAVRFGVPFLAVPYDPKVSSLLADVHYPLAPLWVPGTHVALKHIEGLVDRVWERAPELAVTLATEALAQRAAAERNFTALDALVRM